MTNHAMLPVLQALFLSLGPGMPLLLGFALMWEPLRRRAYALVPFAGLPALLAALFGPTQVAVEVPWFFMGSKIGLDPVGRTFLLFTALLWLAASLYARGYMADEGKRERYAVYFLFAMSGNFGLVLAQEFLGFYLFFSLMSFASYGLVVHKETDAAFRAGRIYLVLVVLGEVMLFAALLLIVSAAGTSSFAESVHGGRGGLLLALLFFGFGIKAGALPLHVWLPLAHPVAPAPASAVLSGAMIKAGLLGWIRYLPHESTAAPFWGELFIVAGLAAAFYGVLVGVFQKDGKTVLAYSSISQMGLMTIIVGGGLCVPGLWPLAVNGAALYALHHGLAKGCLFLGAGMAGKSPAWLRIGMWLPALSLAGLPLTSGAAAKGALKETVAGISGPFHDAVLILLPFAAVGTMLLLFHFLFLFRNSKGEGARTNGWMDAGWLLLFGSVATVFWLWPDGRSHGVSQLAPGKIAAGLWPVLGGIFCGVLLVRSRGKAFPGWIPVPPPGDILELAVWIWRQGREICGKTANLLQGAEKGVRFRDSGMWLSFIPLLKVGKAEKVLQRWAMVGTLFLVVFLLLYFFLSGGVVPGL